MSDVQLPQGIVGPSDLAVSGLNSLWNVKSLDRNAEIHTLVSLFVLANGRGPSGEWPFKNTSLSTTIHDWCRDIRQIGLLS